MNERRARSLVLLAMAAPLAWLAGVAPARAQEKTLWQIGNFDQSSEEFGSRIRFGPSATAQAAPVYWVGRSDWKKDWPAFHPGSANGLAGGREHPFTVVFSLDGPPSGLYTLTVALLPYMPRRPNLRVEINGFRGLFYLRPRLSYDLGDPAAAFVPQYSFEQLDIDLPTRYLKQGDNKLILTAVDDPPAPEDSYGTAGVGVSGIFYDALRLTQDAAREFSPAEIRASATPTVFYRQREPVWQRRLRPSCGSTKGVERARRARTERSALRGDSFTVGRLRRASC